MAETINAYPGCPTLSFMIASKVTSQLEVGDAMCLISGKKGSGKSTASMALAEDIAREISHLRGKEESPLEFFNVDHVKTVTRTGILDLLTSGMVKKGNRVFVLDDFSIQYSSRQFQTLINRMISDLLLLCRIYSNVLICNAVSKEHIDKLGRGLIDYQIQMVSKSVHTGQSIFKCYLFEVGQDGKEYKRFLTWHGMRIRFWLCGRPSPYLEKEYLKMRRENTDAHLEASYKRMQEEEAEKREPKERKVNPIITKNRDRIRALVAEGKKIEAITRETGLSRYIINKCISPFAGGEE